MPSGLFLQWLCETPLHRMEDDLLLRRHIKTSRVIHSTSNVEGRVEADRRLFLELSQTLGSPLVHHQVQSLVQHHEFHTMKLPIIYCFHTRK